MRRVSARGLLLVSLLSALCAGPALAHSGLRRAEPAPDSKLSRAPNEVRLAFSERLEPAYSKLRVEDEKGNEVDLRDAHVDRTDRLHLRVSLPTLGPGVYTVIWRALSVDGHATEGRFTFRVE
jgi:methionine-rich copper-binding protein CopC